MWLEGRFKKALRNSYFVGEPTNRKEALIQNLVIGRGMVSILTIASVSERLFILFCSVLFNVLLSVITFGSSVWFRFNSVLIILFCFCSSSFCVIYKCFVNYKDTLKWPVPFTFRKLRRHPTTCSIHHTHLPIPWRQDLMHTGFPSDTLSFKINNGAQQVSGRGELGLRPTPS
jgi:hypothetical protein